MASDASQPTRRAVIGAGVAAAIGQPSAAGAVPAPNSVAPDDRAYWQAIAGQYDLPDGIIQLENGNWGAMARPVLAAYQQHTAEVNRQTSYYSRRSFDADLARVRKRAAADLGVPPDEIVFTRGATEALQTLIGGYDRLRPGDQVLYADLDYDSMQAAMRGLKSRRGVDAVSIAIPEPASHQALIDAYDVALRSHPKVRLMLLTHVSHRTGLVQPVREIVAMARARGVDVIVDSAHAWGQLDFRLPDLGADFVGLTCQKWIGAPLGVGIVHIAKSRLDSIDRSISEDAHDPDAIATRVHTGTVNLAAMLALADALDFHQMIGARAKERRLRYLRDRWAEPLRSVAGVEVLTPSDPRLTSALTSFRLSGQTTLAANRALAKRLLDEFGIFTVERDGPARGACVRVTPGIFTRESDVDAIARAIHAITKS